MDNNFFENTDLIKVSVEELDGASRTDGSQVNILRERTFNQELSVLLNKIYSNEKGIALSKDKEDVSVVMEESPLERERLLKKCEELIYRVKYDDYGDFISVDPFDFKIDAERGNDVAQFYNSYIIKAMRSIGFEHFAILNYALIDNAFMVSLNSADELLESSLFFSINDPEIKKLNHNKKGIFIDKTCIEEDLFLKKKLLDVFAKCDYKGIYIVRLSDLFTSEELADINFSLWDDFFSPLLVIFLKSDAELTPVDCYNKLTSTLNIPFLLYLMQSQPFAGFKNYSPEDVLLSLNILLKTPLSQNMKVGFLQLLDFSSKEKFFILKFVISKIKMLLHNSSFFLRASTDRCFFIVSDEESVAICSIIEEVNSLNDKELLTVKTLSKEDFVVNPLTFIF
ncbi:MAG TPA: hypothetical protein P5554_09815 [Spirochaetota bacterium]|nr:hypothetical protein [Spirochaetota bacterium]